MVTKALPIAWDVLNRYFRGRHNQSYYGSVGVVPGTGSRPASGYGGTRRRATGGPSRRPYRGGTSGYYGENPRKRKLKQAGQRTRRLKRRRKYGRVQRVVRQHPTRKRKFVPSGWTNYKKARRGRKSRGYLLVKKGKYGYKRKYPNR